jgi:transposase-like protein
MPEPTPGARSADWVRVKVRCRGCAREVEIKALPDRRDQRWACPRCHRRHDEIGAE